MVERLPFLPPGPPTPTGAGIPPFSARLAPGAVTVRQLMVAGRSGVQLIVWPGVGARPRGGGSAPAGFLEPRGVDSWTGAATDPGPHPLLRFVPRASSLEPQKRDTVVSQACLGV